MRFPPARLRPPVLRHTMAVVIAGVLAAAGYTVGASRPGPDLPESGSVDVGFVRDMVVHHSQAVTLAMIVLQRATVPAVREIAEDIATTQQREAGEMTGWLQQWGLPTTTAAPAMSWMTHTPAASAAAADPAMPGMATRRDVARLAVTRGRNADLMFCRLMQLHHLGGLHMINEVIARGSRPEVIALAEQMRTAQQREINQINRLLTQVESPASEPG
jgi:uncharacterized protein (DUF305 family)